MDRQKIQLLQEKFMKMLTLKRTMSILALSALAAGVSAQSGGKIASLDFLTRYSAGAETAAEIVAWNKASGKVFVINGADRTVDLVSLKAAGTGTPLQAEKKIRLEDAANTAGVSFGDVTSVAVSPDGTWVAVCVQDEVYTKNGCVVFLDKDGNFKTAVTVGVQPDMGIFTKDGKKLLIANEGEPRMGYGEGIADPAGSVSIIEMGTSGPGAVKTADFSGFTADSLRAKGVIIQTTRTEKGNVLSYRKPAEDLEPEYIAVSDDGNTAWISLQEANAIAKLDIAKAMFTEIDALPYKDYSAPANAADFAADKKAELAPLSVKGLLMPDAIAWCSVGGKGYILTANEGDGREWPLLPDGEPDEKSPAFYKNEIKAGKIKSAGIAEDMTDTEKAVLARAAEKDSPIGSLVLHDEASRNAFGKYDRLMVFGGRSFTVFEADTMKQVYDSGSFFEAKSKELFPEQFNSSNTKVALDDRSPKKGPEPEGVTTAEIDGTVYAFIGLERIGGVMVFDLSDPASPVFRAYANSRDFSTKVGGDSGPEGLAVVNAAESPTGKPLLLAANESSGTMAVYQITVK